MKANIKIYSIKRLNTEFEEIFDSLIAVYDEWHDSFIDSELDNQVYYWYSEDEFINLRLGQMMDDNTIYLIDIDFENYRTHEIELHEEETL